MERLAWESQGCCTAEAGQQRSGDGCSAICHMPRGSEVYLSNVPPEIRALGGILLEFVFLIFLVFWKKKKRGNPVGANNMLEAEAGGRS